MKGAAILGLSLGLGLLLTPPLRAHAAGMVAVSPITMEFPAGKRAVSAEISNPGDEAVTVQLRVFDWRTDAEGDHYTPTADIGFSPPIFELPPKGRQVVRLVLLTPADSQRERAYRLFVDQLPRPETVGVQMPVRLVLPVFAASASPPRRQPPAAQSLRWAAKRTAAGELLVTAENIGARRVRLVNLGYQGGGKAEAIQPGLAGYVLAGAVRGWNCACVPPAGPIEITAESEEGQMRATVALPSP